MHLLQKRIILVSSLLVYKNGFFTLKYYKFRTDRQSGANYGRF